MSAYAFVSDLYVHGAPASAFGSLTDGDKLEAIESASAELDAAISSQGEVPLTGTIPKDLVQRVCHIATYELMCRVGFNPSAGADQNYLIRSQSARTYLRDIARGVVHPRVTFSTVRSVKAQPQVKSKTLRGW